MKRTAACLFVLLITVSLTAGRREYLWPKGSMPDSQNHQIAAMTDEASAKGFNPDKHRTAYIEWFDKPSKDVANGSCMILISGGAYNSCCDVGYIKEWHEKLTALGVQCVNLVYRTPRPEGIPIWQTAWEDGQRAVRMVRSEAFKRGFDPEKIGTISMSAGSHLALLLATSSQTPAYTGIDALDSVPCHINWAIVNAPAYITTDGETGTPATRQGYGPGIRLSKCLKFDSKTCPISLHHGGEDPYSPDGSTLVYRQLRRMGIPAELHLYADQGHKALGFDRGVEFMRQMGFLGPLAEEEVLLDRYAEDIPCVTYRKEFIWPEGKTPDASERQCAPYIEWYIPEKLTTDAVQIVFSGGGYTENYPESFSVAPTRRWLNRKGMAVVTLKYRMPRPEGLAKHTSAWQDLQRAVRVVRSQAASYGLDPDKIGILGSSAGGHLTLMGTTSSRHGAYWPIDDIDTLPCNVRWGVCIYPAYVLTDGIDGPNTGGGNEDDAALVQDFSFDMDTCPMIFLHGDEDPYAAMGSVKVWEKLRSMGIQCDLHTYAGRSHCFQRECSPGTGSYTHMERIWEFLTAKGYL